VKRLSGHCISLVDWDETGTPSSPLTSPPLLVIMIAPRCLPASLPIGSMVSWFLLLDF
jgi:hypothetical protein